ncbi:MAG TPA: ABC transporter permease [Vicinamibacterales bacterium]|nr:ABC transporter permease [Vicinamibacterales bacterium]
MRTLNTMLLRDLSRLKAQATAIGLVVASGITLFVGTAMTSRALRLSELQYYDEQRLAHVWSGLARAPESVVRQLAAIPGVSAVDGRLVARGVLDLPGVVEPASGLFIAIPPRSGHSVNDVYIRRGRHVEVGSNEALVNEPFAERSGLKPGDSVDAVIAGQRVHLHIVGIALSPEFLMQIAPGGLIPDDRRFGVFWLPADRLADLLDMRKAVNDVALRLSSAANEATVIAAVDRVLEPYGGQGAYGRGTQPSHVMLEAHIVPVAALAVVVPSIFLAVAVFLVNMVLSRVVATERTQVGMMKAFGYSNARLAMHYLCMVALIVGGGIALGLPFGVWLGRGMSAWFATFFRFPVLVFRFEPGIIAAGATVMLGGSIAGALTTLRSVVKLAPAVAMTPAVPVYQATLVDRFTKILRLFAPSVRMIVRSVTRHPLRAVLTTAGMSMAVAIVVFGGFTADAMNRVVDVRFQREERQDLAVVLTEKRSLDSAIEFKALPGVRVAEPYRAVAARLRVAGDVQDVTLIGLTPASRLRHVVDMQYRTLAIPTDGLIVSTWLARQSRVRLGQPVALEIREGRRRIVTTRVVALVDEPLGTYIYMDLHALGRLLSEPNTFSAANVLVDPVYQRQLYAALKRAPHVLGVEFRRDSIANFRAMGDQSVAFIRKIEILFAVIIAFGVVYNVARIAVAERSYELATLRVLGFRRDEISAILFGEIALLAAPAVPIGCAVGYAFSAWLSSSLSSRLFRFPIVLESTTYAFAILVFVVAALGSAFVVRARLDRLDLVEVLKARE